MTLRVPVMAISVPCAPGIFQIAIYQEKTNAYLYFHVWILVGSWNATDRLDFSMARFSALKIQHSLIY